MCKLKGLAQPRKYHNEGDVWDHTIRALLSLTDEEDDPNPLPAASPTLALKWATLFHDIGKYEAFEIDNERIRYNHHAEMGSDTASKILKKIKISQKSY